MYTYFPHYGKKSPPSLMPRSAHGFDLQLEQYKVLSSHTLNYGTILYMFKLFSTVIYQG